MILLKIRVVDRVITSYSGGQILMETPLLLVVIKGRKFNISFNITPLGLIDNFRIAIVINNKTII